MTRKYSFHSLRRNVLNMIRSFFSGNFAHILEIFKKTMFYFFTNTYITYNTYFFLRFLFNSIKCLTVQYLLKKKPAIKRHAPTNNKNIFKIRGNEELKNS